MSRPGHWPSPVGLRVLRAALAEGDDAVRAWAALRPTFDLDTLDPGATRLVPLLEWNLRRHDLENPWRDRMRGVYRYWWSHNQVLFHLAARALERLRSESVPTIVLKGAPLAVTYYGDVGMRPMSDIDVLVPAERVEAALGSLRARGWHPESIVDASFRRLRHGVSLHDPSGHTLDLHWAVHEDDCRPGADDDAWARSRPVEIAGQPTHMLAASSQLVHAFAHGAKWAGDPGYRWVADAMLIVRSGEVDWEQVLAEARERRFVVRTRSCLDYLRVALDAPIPAAVVERLASIQVSSFERLEHQIRTRVHPILGELPRYWFAYLRTGHAAIGSLPIGFGRYLQYAWGLPSIRAVPGAAAQRAAHRLRGVAFLPPAGDEVHPQQG